MYRMLAWRGDAAKVAALEDMGAIVYPDVNRALGDVLAADGHRYLLRSLSRIDSHRLESLD